MKTPVARPSSIAVISASKLPTGPKPDPVRESEYRKAAGVREGTLIRTSVEVSASTRSGYAESASSKPEIQSR